MFRFYLIDLIYTPYRLLDRKSSRVNRSCDKNKEKVTDAIAHPEVFENNLSITINAVMVFSKHSYSDASNFIEKKKRFFMKS